MTNGAEGRLARVTYLPGVKPPSAPQSEAEPDEPVSLDAIPGLVRAREISARVVEAREHRTPEPETETRSSRAHNVSLNALTRRGVSSAELTDLLKRREVPDSDIDDEVARLTRVGLLDDRQLAETLVRTLRERKGLGRTAIIAELRRRRIDQAAIDDAIDEAYESGDDDLSRARELALKRAPQLRSLDPETARRRLGAFLMRKGYSGSIVASAAAAALAPNHPSFRGSTGGLSGRTGGSSGPRFE